MNAVGDIQLCKMCVEALLDVCWSAIGGMLFAGVIPLASRANGF